MEVLNRHVNNPQDHPEAFLYEDDYSLREGFFVDVESEPRKRSYARVQHLSPDEQQEHVRQLARLRARRYRKRHQQPKKKPDVQPVWRKWNPELIQMMLDMLGYSMHRLTIEARVSWEVLARWRQADVPPSEAALSRLTQWAEWHGWWWKYPFPPRVVLIFTRKEDEFRRACAFWRLTNEQARWIRSGNQLVCYPHTMVKAIIVRESAKKTGVLLHPGIKRWMKKFGKRPPIITPTLGGKRTIR